MRMDDCGDRDDLFREVEHERRLHRRLMANPHPQDPDFPDCDDCDYEDDDDE